jgi:hypothetical protein
MKNSLVLFIVISLGIISCKKEIITGLSGTVKYGKGDCMPSFGPINRTYSNYNGRIYFIRKSAIDNQVTGDINNLKATSIYTTVKNGNFEVALPIDTFLVMPSDVYQYSSANTAIIKEGIVLNMEFSFWKCTTY